MSTREKIWLQRADKRDSLIEVAFRNKNSYCILEGEYGVGKKILVKQAIEKCVTEDAEKILICCDALELSDSLFLWNDEETEEYAYTFWKAFVYGLDEKIRARLNNSADEELLKAWNRAYGKWHNPLSADEVFDALNELLKLCSEMHIIFVVYHAEEMASNADAASVFEQFVSLKDEACGLSLLLVSQEPLNKLAGKHAALCARKFCVETLQGFEDFELEEYKKILSESLVIPKDGFEQMEYYCGNRPCLWSELRDELEKYEHINASVVDIAFAEALKKASVEVFYEGMYDRLVQACIEDEEDKVREWCQKETEQGKIPQYFAEYAWKRRLDAEDFFIGRKEEQEVLKNKIFLNTPDKGTFLAVVGPNEVGKSTLVERSIKIFEKEKKSNVLILQCSLYGITETKNHSYYFGKKIFEQIYESNIGKKLQKIEVSFQTVAENFKKRSGYYTNVKDDILEVFKLLNTYKVYTIINVDEFDIAKQMNFEEDFYNIFYALYQKEYKLSVIVQGRRRITDILYDEKFANMFELLMLPGFNDKEWEIYEKYLGFDINTKQDGKSAKDRILYYCGRHTKMLMVMRQALRKMYQGQVEISAAEVDACYQTGRTKAVKKVSEELEDICSHLMSVLAKETIDPEGEQKCLEPFLEVCLNMSLHADKLKEWKDKLYERGFLVKNGETYEPIARLALDYVAMKAADSDEKNLTEFMLYERKAEKAVRSILSKPLLEKYNQDKELMKREIFEYLKPYQPHDKHDKQKSYDSMKNEFRKTGIEYEESDATVMDVLAYPEYFKIMVGYWTNHFARRMQLSEFKGVRNAVAHKIDQYYPAERLKKYMESLAELIHVCSQEDALTGLKEEPIKWHKLAEQGEQVEFEAISIEESELEKNGELVSEQKMWGYMNRPGENIDIVVEAFIDLNKCENVECAEWLGDGKRHLLTVVKRPSRSNKRYTYELAVVVPENLQKNTST